MKKHIPFIMALIVFVMVTLFSITTNAQYSNSYNPPKGWGEPELFMPVVVMGGTFAIIEYRFQTETGNSGQCALIAISGITTLVLTHVIFKKIRVNKKKYKHRRYKHR